MNSTARMTAVVTLIAAGLAGLTIARAQDNPPAMPPDDMPMMMEPSPEAGAPPMQMTPDDEMMGQMGMMGMMMMQQMSEMMELCMQMMRSMMEAPHGDIGGNP